MFIKYIFHKIQNVTLKMFKKSQVKVKIKILKNFIESKNIERNWVFVTNSDFLILVSLQSNFVKLDISNYEFC